MCKYSNDIRNNGFAIIIFLYAFISVVTIVLLVCFSYYYIKRVEMKNKLNDQVNIMKSIDHYIQRKKESVQIMLGNVYRNQQLAATVSYLLKYSYEDYIAYRLDQFSSSTNGSSQGLDFFKDRLKDDPDIENIILYSSEKEFLFVYYQNNWSKLIETNKGRSFVPDAMSLPSNGISASNEWVRQAIGQSNSRLFAVESAINDMATYKLVGELHVYFNSDAISRALSSYNDSAKGYFLVLTPDGTVLFDSSGQFYGKPFPYANEFVSSTGTGSLDPEVYVSTLHSANSDYIVVNVTSKAELASSTRELVNLIVLLGILCVLLTFIPSAFVIKFAKRIHRITRSMRRVETGDMSVRIQDNKEDELGQISRGFNDMMDKLARHIDRVYKAEILQKQNELKALQARVHPHFLYNTLEVIRMRAVSLGAHDISDMIYNLAGLFKSFVKSMDVVRLQEELEHCRKYLELFRIRYRDKFQYEIHADQAVRQLIVAGMSLQPLIENYIVHGLWPDRRDNTISISADRYEDELRIVIKDNGRGIDREKLQQIRQRLRMPEDESKTGSFGIRSVNEKLQLMYGKQYGLTIDSEPGAGTCITVRFPAIERSEETDVPRLSG
ncbi:histidine kinase [Paenibacillus sp. GCM10023248]|uniref:sensor histidine kinase n=1 Tax=unclassified Paenibacillus TaxID=185978 RepID=UPI00237871AD|nr:histidine kinase [Paenibacillus sp. MAHUQ-63]MDD9267187.1 histidine kinase [Paenibacillus sp. MAHUQ-63]